MNFINLTDRIRVALVDWCTRLAFGWFGYVITINTTNFCMTCFPEVAESCWFSLIWCNCFGWSLLWSHPSYSFVRAKWETVFSRTQCGWNMFFCTFNLLIWIFLLIASVCNRQDGIWKLQKEAMCVLCIILHCATPLVKAWCRIIDKPGNGWSGQLIGVIVKLSSSMDSVSFLYVTQTYSFTSFPFFALLMCS